MNFGNGALLAPALGRRPLLSVGEIGRACFPAGRYGKVIVGGVVLSHSCPDSRWCGWRNTGRHGQGKRLRTRSDEPAEPNGPDTPAEQTSTHREEKGKEEEASNKRKSRPKRIRLKTP